MRLLQTSIILILATVPALAQLKTDRLIVCGHRGGFYDKYPENSLALMDHVLQASPDPVMVEIDLRKTADEKIYLLHDETLDRTTTGTGKLNETPAATLKSLQLKNADGSVTNFAVPSYDTLLAFAKARKLLLMLDVKGGLWAEAIAGVTRAGIVNQALVLTFSAADTKRVYDLSREVKISVLVRNEADWAAIEKLQIPPQNLVAYLTDTTPASLGESIKKKGVLLMMDVSEYTKHDGKLLTKEYYRDKVKQHNLDILITDFPVEVVRYLR